MTDNENKEPAESVYRSRSPSPPRRHSDRERSNSAPGTPDKSPPREGSRGKSPRRRRSRDRSMSRSRSLSPRRRSRSRSLRRRSLSRDRSQSPDVNKANSGNVLYFAGLHIQTREQDLEDICSKFGTVTAVNIIYDPRSGESRGFGFLSMSTEKESDEVVTQLNGRELDGKPLTIEKARRAGPRKATPGRYLGKLNNRSRYPRSSDRYDRRYDYGPAYDRSPPRYRRSPPRYRDDYSPGRYRRSPPRSSSYRRDRSPGYDYDRRYR